LLRTSSWVPRWGHVCIWMRTIYILYLDALYIAVVFFFFWGGGDSSLRLDLGGSSGGEAGC
jgi:hypothetical protein